MAEAPDVIVLGGDYVTWGDRALRRGRPPTRWRRSSAPHGVFAILGNHDDDRDMPAALTAKGFVVLRDARTRLTVRGETLDFAGIRYWTRRVDRHRARAARRVAERHSAGAHADAAGRGTALAVPLVLSGHTHGGQIVLPGSRRHRGARVPGHRRDRTPRGHDDLRQPRRRHRVHAGSSELSTRSRDPHPAAGRGLTAACIVSRAGAYCPTRILINQNYRGKRGLIWLNV